MRKAGFDQRTGKGSHTNWYHPLYSGRITISGKDGNDAKDYQKNEVLNAIKEVKKREKDEQ